MYRAFAITLLFLSSFVFADVHNKNLACDINKVQKKDWSEDVTGYPKGDIEGYISEWERKSDTNPKYLFYLAKSHYDGAGVSLDRNKAINLYQKAVDSGHAPSMNNLAIINAEDSGKFFSLEKSFNLLCQSAQAGFPLAQANLGEVFINDGKERKAFHWLRLAVKNKNLRAALLLSDLHKNTESVFYDDSKSNQYLEMASEMGSIVAQSILGENYFLGLSGYKKDLEKAEYWLLKSAEKGNIYSIRNLSNFYKDRDVNKSFYWASKGVDKKDVSSILKMGSAYHFGDGTVIDFQKSIELYIQVVKLANLNDSFEKNSAAIASSHLAFIYSFGYQSIPVDLLETEKWLKKSVELGRELEIEKLIKVNMALKDFSEVIEIIGEKTEFNKYIDIINNPNSPESMFEIGMIMTSYGLNKGLDFLEKSAQKSNVKAQSLLSEIYLGIDSKFHGFTDKRLGLYWGKKAANQGALMAMNNLGYAYENGMVGEVNKDEAFKWYQKAADGGLDLGYRNLGALYASIGSNKKSFENYKKAADLGNTLAMIDLSTKYSKDKDFDKSFNWALRAAKRFDMQAMYIVGSNYLYGIGVEKDIDLALYWIAKSINNNPNYIATSELQGWYVDFAKEDLGRIHKDINQAIKFTSGKDFFKEYDAKNGDDQKKYAVGWAYYKEQNLKKAIYWFEAAANNNFIQAQRTLGHLYSGNLKSTNLKDFKNAEHWYKKAILNADLDSIAALGWVYSTIYEDSGIKNPVFDILKANDLLEQARKKGSAWAINTIIHNYQFNIGKGPTEPVNVKYIIDLIKDLIALNNKYYSAEESYITALKIQVENNRYIDEILLNKGMSVLTLKANTGESKKQLDLAEIYLTKESRFYDKKKGFYWLNEASKTSIEANIKLAELFFIAEDYNFYKYGSSLKKAIHLYESKTGKDYKFYKNSYADGMIHAYHSLANYYVAADAADLAEVNARKASNLYPFSKKNKHEINKNIILASIGNNLDESKKLLSKYLNIPIKGGYVVGDGNTEMYDSLNYAYSSLIGLHSKLRQQKKYKESSQLLIDVSEKFTESVGLLFRPIIELEIARDFISLDNFKGARFHLKRYKEFSDDLKPNFFQKLYANIVYGVEGTNKIVSMLQNIKNPVEEVLYQVISGIVDIEEDNFNQGYLKIKKALDSVNELGMPIRAVDLDFAIQPIQHLVSNKEYDKAKDIMQTVINLYRQNSKLRIKDGLEINQNERKYIANAINEYIRVSTLSGENLKDKGFEEMQLVSGLTLSKALLDSIKLRQYTGTEFAMRKILEDLYRERNRLIAEKFDSLTQKISINKLDNKLNKIDKDISKYELQLIEKDESIIDAFISPLQEVQNSLNNNDALISTLISGNRSYVWLVTKDGVYRNDSELTSHQITVFTQQLLDAVDPTSTSNNKFPYSASNELYGFMIKPFENKLINIDRLIVVPDGVISKIPLTILSKKIDGKKIESKENSLELHTRGLLPDTVSINTFNRPQWLIEDFAVATVPSIYSFVQLNKELGKSKKTIESFVGIGNPILSGVSNVLIRGAFLSDEGMRGNLSRSLSSLAPLPETEGELKSISKMFKRSNLFLGKDATEANIRNADLSKYDVVAFATHALVSNEIDNLYEPALVLTPVDDNIASNDGLLSTKEVSELNLNAEIVVLSACNTASAINESSPEGLTGLANSFFNAGAKSLLVSYWSVISESAVDITTRIFKPSNNGRSYAHKHRNAILDLLKNTKDSYKHHPSYWAPFAIIGVN